MHLLTGVRSGVVSGHGRVVFGDLARIFVLRFLRPDRDEYWV